MNLVILLSLIYQVLSLNSNETRLSVDYFLNKNIKYACYFSCENQYRKLFKKHQISNALLTDQSFNND